MSSHVFHLSVVSALTVAVLTAGDVADDHKLLGISLSVAKKLTEYTTGPTKMPANVSAVQLRDAFLGFVNDDIKACGITVKEQDGKAVPLKGMVKPVSAGLVNAIGDSALHGAFLVLQKDWDDWEARHPDLMAKTKESVGTRRIGDFLLVHAATGPNAIDEKKVDCMARIFGPLGLASIGLRMMPQLTASSAKGKDAGHR